MSGDFESWIGHSVMREDLVTARLVSEYRAIFDPYLFKPGDHRDCPAGLHWGLAPAMPGMTGLGLDGTEAKGGFLPPIALPRRMWAGGGVESFAPIRLGMEITRVSTISGIKMRDGRSGPLGFISVIHEIKSGGALLVRERQNLVFRDGKPKPAAPVPLVDAVNSDVEWSVKPSPVLLFRFSAFTFNGHRIHYDLPHAVETEGYEGLVVHGPLQAALLLNQASAALGHVPRRFEYRCLAPLIAGPAITVASRRDASNIQSRIVDHRGVVTSEATAIA